MTNDGSGGEPSSLEPGVTSTLTPEKINWVSSYEVDRLTRWHFGWTLLGSIGGVVLSAGLCRLPSSEAEPLTALTESLLWIGGILLFVSWGGFWGQVAWRKWSRGSGRPVKEIKFTDTTGGSTS